MKIFVAALVLVALCVLGMAVGVLFHKGFPKTDIDRNEEMRKRGIRCFKHEDESFHSKKTSAGSLSCDGNFSASCEGCAFFDLEKQNKK